MALISEVIARYSPSKLVQLTTQDDTSATTVNMTVLGYAVTDVEGYIEVYAGAAYDNDDARFVALACDGVVTLLQARKRGLILEQDEGWRRWVTRVKELAEVTGRNRVLPKSSSQREPERFRQNVQAPFGSTEFNWLRPPPRRPRNGQ